MLNLILYSAGNNDESVLDYVEDNSDDQIVLCAVLSETVAVRSLKSGHAFAATHIFPACHLTRWAPAVATLLRPSLPRGNETLLVDTDFAQTHGIGLASFLGAARAYDFFAVNGRFRRDGDTYSFAFPTWEMCYFSPALWEDAACAEYMRHMRPVQNDDDRYYTVQYFFAHFSKTHSFGCLMDDQTRAAFDPMAAPTTDTEALLARREDALETG